MTDRYDLHGSLGYRITLFARITERRFERALKPLGLSRVTWCVLLAVGQEGLQAPSRIAAFIGIDRTATSRALRGLEQAGLLRRKEAEGDRRCTAVSLTDKGRARLAAANRAAARNAAHFRAKLSDAQHLALHDALDALMAGEPLAVRGL